MGEKTEVARPRRVVLDTYVAVSAPVFREGRLAWLREAWAAGRVVPLVSAETLAELVRVLANPKLKLSDEETKNVLAHYMENPKPGTDHVFSFHQPEMVVCPRFACPMSLSAMAHLRRYHSLTPVA